MASSSRVLGQDVLLNGRYRIVRVLGRGGMGTVYLAHHQELDDVLAIKEISGPDTADESYQMALELCRKESKLLFRLQHPNLPKVTDAFVEDDRFYLVMEFIDGVTLETKLREAGGRPLDPRLVAEWGLQITDVLGYLHTLDPPLIFRDLKPANIMVQANGHLKLIDFGIARRFQDDPSKKKDTALLGSVGYSPPEQFGQHQTDTRSDIYAFGATLHHLLTGRDPAMQPFKFPPANVLNPHVPANFSALVDRCLALEADKRPSDIRDVAMDLLVIRDQLAASAPAGLPAPAAGQMVSPHASTVPSHSTTGSGPKIISSKLRDTEPRRVSLGAIAAALVALIAIVGGTLYALKKPAPQKVNAPTTQTKSTVPETKPFELPKATPNIEPPVSPNSMEVPPPAANDDVKIESATSPGIAPDPQNGDRLVMQVKGTIKGQNSKPGMVAIFFYDDKEQPILVTPGTPYSNDKGHLSVAHSLAIEGEVFPMDQTLYIPVAQFPKEKVMSAIKYRCVVYVDQLRKAETGLLTLPFLLTTTPATDGTPESPMDGTNNTAGNDPTGSGQ
jgi:serine/threonine protein kinase